MKYNEMIEKRETKRERGNHCLPNWKILSTGSMNYLNYCEHKFHSNSEYKPIYRFYQLKRLGEVCRKENRYKVVCDVCIKYFDINNNYQTQQA